MLEDKLKKLGLSDEKIARAKEFATQRAEQLVQEEANQAMEALVHNLNTLHCLPAHEKVWVRESGSVKPITVQELHENFEEKKYEVMTVNLETNVTEFNYVLATAKQDNHRRLVTLTDEDGRQVTITDNHKVISFDKNDNLVEILPEEAEHVATLDDKQEGVSAVKKRIIKKEISNSGEEFVYDINVNNNHNFLGYTNIFLKNSRAGSQTPFSSLNTGTDTSKEGRMITKSLLKALWEGLGNGETPIFPITIFKVKEGVNYFPEDPNYDLFKEAMKVSAKRLFPNFEFLDTPYNIKTYKPGPDYETATMGAVTGQDIITVKYLDQVEILPFAEAWEKYHDKEGVLIYDRGNFVKIKTWIKNDNAGDWYDITFDNSKVVTITSDHPLPTQRGRVECKDLHIGDTIPVALPYGQGVASEDDRLEIVSIDFVGDAGGIRYDVETESDRFDVSGINSHNCRTRVVASVFPESNGLVSGRGNLSFTSINLPRIAIERMNVEDRQERIDSFFKRLDELCELCREQLLVRFEWQARQKVKNFPFLIGQKMYNNHTGHELGPDDEIREIIKHGTLSIGFIGLAETLVALIGKHHGESEEAQELGLKIVGRIRENCDRFSQEEHMNFTCLATPAESLCFKFLRKDKEKFGIIPRITDREYYTNSNHIPVYFPISAFRKIELEAPYHALCNAGHIAYIEVQGDPLENLEAFEQIVRKMHDENIGYGAVNHPVDYCEVCGFTGIIGETCPQCGRKEYEWASKAALRKLKACGCSVSDIAWENAY